MLRIASSDPRHDGRRTFVRGRARCVNDYVVIHASVDPLCLVASHPESPVRPLQLTGFGYRRFAVHTNPDHGQPFQRRSQSRLGFPTAEKDVDDDHARASPRHRRQTLVPGQFGRTECVTDDNRPVSRDLECASGRRIAGAMRQRANQVVDSERQPCPLKALLQTGGERRFARARTTVENNDLDSHRSDSSERQGQFG